MEKERDFYFGKLRNIELICQEKDGEDDPTLSRIIQILYATDVSSRLPTELAHTGLYYSVITLLLLELFGLLFQSEVVSSRSRDDGTHLSTFLRWTMVSNLFSRLDI